MGNNNFFLKIIGQLDKQQTQKSINNEISLLGEKLKKVNIEANLSKNSLSSIKNQLKNIDMNISKQSVANIKSQIENALKGLKINSDTSYTKIRNAKGININQDADRSVINSSQTGSLVRRRTFKAKKFDNNLYSAKEAQTYFSNLLKNENALISVTEKFDSVNKNTLKSFIVNIKRASGEVESLNYELEKFGSKKNPEWRFANTSSTVNDSGALKQIQQIENAISKYQAKLAQFENVNANITTGLSKPLNDFKQSLKDLQNGKITIDDMKKSFNELEASASSIKGNLPKQLDSVASAIKEISNGNSTISNLSNDFSKLGIESSKVTTALSNAKNSLDEISRIESNEGRNDNWSKKYSEYINYIKEAEEELKRLKKEQTTNTKIDNIDNSFESYLSKIRNLETEYQKFGYSALDTKEKLSSLNKAYLDLVKAPKDQRIEKERQFQSELSKTNGHLKNLKNTYASLDARTKTANSIKKFMDINTGISKNAREELQSYVHVLETSDDLTVPSLNNIKNAFEQIQMNERLAGNLGKSLFDGLTEGAKKFVTWGIATRGVMLAWTKLQDAGQAVYDIDTAMTSLYKVTDATDASYTKFLENASKNAKDLGRNVSSLVDQTAEWAKGGYDLSKSSGLAQVSSIYSNVGDVDDATAVKNIVSTLKGFNLEAEKAINVVDDLNILGKVMLPLTNYIG